MASTIGSLGAAEAVLGSWAASITRPQPDRLDVSIHPNDLLTVVRALVNESWGYLKRHCWSRPSRTSCGGR